MHTLISRDDRDRMEAVMAALHRCTTTDDLMAKTTTPKSMIDRLEALFPDYMQDAQRKCAALAADFPTLETGEATQ